VEILKTALLVGLCWLVSPSLVLAQGSTVLADVQDNLLDAKGELMRLPPLQDLLKIAIQTAPRNRQIDIAKQQEKEREKLWKLAQMDILTLQGVAIAGRRDVF